MKKILIVGGVAGGATVAARLRRLDEKAQIIMFERGEYISFANCGLPYYIGDVITNRNALLVQTAAGMSKRFNIDIRVFSEVIDVDSDNMEIKVKNLKTNEEYTEKYDELILSPGAKPLVPAIPGLNEANNVFTLRNMADTDKIKSYVDNSSPKEAVVIGGGFIGIEMAENLAGRGIRVHLVEMLDQVMAPFDFEMAQILHGHINENDVELILKDGVKEFTNQGKSVVLESGRTLNSDITILSIGVRPENNLAKAAGLDLGSRGHILVNESFETSKPHIYAVGDAIETFDRVSKTATSVPLASPANRQARILADRINGIDSKYKGVLGTSVAKVFELTAACTGSNEKKLQAMNIKDYKSIHIHPLSNAGYYPSAMPMTLKLIFNRKTGEIYGAQAIGGSGVEKRIDVIATAIASGLTVRDLEDLELAYAPPFSSAKDPVNMAGYVATNIIDDLVDSVYSSEIDEIVAKGGFLIDVSTKAEFDIGHIKGALNYPIDELRSTLNELPKDKPIYVCCRVGLRGYLANRILRQNGFNSFNVDGGYRSYAQLKIKIDNERFSVNNVSCADNPDVLKAEVTEGGELKAQDEKKNNKCIKVDARGLQCPGPISAVFGALKDAKDGDKVEVLASDPGFKKDIAAWCSKMGYNLQELSTAKNVTRAVIVKSNSCEIGSCSANRSSVSNGGKNGATMVVFSGDFDKAMASFIIATGAASMGKEVTMFFTFWGLNILRRKDSKVKKTGMERMFGNMMPKGTSQLTISKMNMAGMGTKMIKDVMKKKNVDSLELMLKRAKDMGVKFVACAMSMDIMGIKPEELIDGVEVAGVASYLSETEDGNLNLFI